MSLHDRITREIREGPTGSKIGAFFDLDQTLLAGFSATSFVRERLVTGRMSPQELGTTFYGALSFALGRTGFSALMTATTAAYRGLAESMLEEVGEEASDEDLARAAARMRQRFQSLKNRLRTLAEEHGLLERAD